MAAPSRCCTSSRRRFKKSEHPFLLQICTRPSADFLLVLVDQSAGPLPEYLPPLQGNPRSAGRSPVRPPAIKHMRACVFSRLNRADCIHLISFFPVQPWQQGYCCDGRRICLIVLLSYSGRKTLVFRRRLQYAPAGLIRSLSSRENFCVFSSADLQSVRIPPALAGSSPILDTLYAKVDAVLA